MRHKKLNKKFGRNRSARSALIRDLAKATLKYESIATTKIKAKQARKLVERLITLGKEGSLNSRRKAFKVLCDHRLVGLLFTDLAPRFKNVNGGFTRIYSTMDRRGDGSAQVILELTKREIKEKHKKVKAEKVQAKKEEIEEAKPVVKEERAPVSEKAEEKPKAEEKKVHKPQEKPRVKETKPPAKFLGGLRKLFKKERDSL